MESFFLAETTKYLYLLFDEENFLHNDAAKGNLIKTTENGECVVDAGPYIFNTEAHPIDMSALHCCHDHKINLFEGLDLSQFSDSTLFKKERELIELKQNEAFTDCKKPTSYLLKEPGKKSASTVKMPLSPSLAVDIEVFDEDNKPAGDILVENFERIKNDIPAVIKENKSSDDVGNQITVNDLKEFFRQKRENFQNPLQVLEYTISFLKNFTLAPGLKANDPNIMMLFSSFTKKKFEGKQQTLWNLYRLQQKNIINLKLLLTIEVNKQLLQQTLLVLNGDESDESNEVIWQKVNELSNEYERSMVNTTAMQAFLLKILTQGTTERQTNFKPWLEPQEISELPIETFAKSEQLRLFTKAKQFIESATKLQNLLAESNKLLQSQTNTNESQTTNKAATDDLIIAKQTQQTNESSESSSSLSYQVNDSYQQSKLNFTNTTDIDSSSPTSTSASDDDNNTSGSVWSQLVHTILRKTTTPKLKFDTSDLLQKTRNSLQKLTADIPVHYNVLTCPRPKFIERFAYRYYYP